MGKNLLSELWCIFRHSFCAPRNYLAFTRSVPFRFGELLLTFRANCEEELAGSAALLFRHIVESHQHAVLTDGKICSLSFFFGLCQGGGQGAQSKERKGSNFAV